MKSFSIGETVLMKFLSLPFLLQIKCLTSGAPSIIVISASARVLSISSFCSGCRFTESWNTKKKCFLLKIIGKPSWCSWWLDHGEIRNSCQSKPLVLQGSGIRTRKIPKIVTAERFLIAMKIHGNYYQRKHTKLLVSENLKNEIAQNDVI